MKSHTNKVTSQLLLLIFHLFVMTELKSEEIVVDKNWVIVVREKPSSSIDLASKELARGFLKATGETLQIQNSLKKEGKNIVIGYHSEIDDQKYAKEKSVSKTEVFSIRKIKEGIGIFGSESDIDPIKDMNKNHGALYGVYEFMEKYMGFRWYGPGELGECVEKKSRVVFDGKTIDVQAHSFSRTFWPFTIKGYSKDETSLFLLRNKMGGSRHFGPNHSVDDISYLWQQKNVPDSIYAINANGEKRIGRVKAVHGKEGSRRIQWHTYSHFCFQSEEFLELYLKEIDRWYQGEGRIEGTFSCMPHDAEYIYFVPPDNESLNPCYHSYCQKIIHASPTGHSELVWRFVIKLAKRIKEKYPDKKLAVLAYESNAYLYPPENIPISDYPDNIHTRICYNPYQPYIGYKAYQKIHDDLTREWSKRSVSISIWQYISTSRVSYPAECPRLIFEFYKKYQEKIRSGFANPWYEIIPRTESKPQEVNCPDFNQMRLNLFFTMRSLWNPNYDFEEEYKKYIDLYFGPAKEEMGRFFDESIKRWENIDQYVDVPIPPKTYIPSEIVYNKIYSYQNIKSWEGIINQAKIKVSDAQNAIYLKRIQQIQDEYLNNFFKQSKAYSMATEKKQMLPTISAKVTIDGHLGEEVWKGLPKNHFYQSSGPINPNYNSWFKAFKDENHLYVGLWAEDPHVQSHISNIKTNDESVYFSDSVEIFISNDYKLKKDYYHLGFTTSDLCYDADSFENRIKWNSGSRSKTFKHKDSYTMEIMIPLKSFKNDKRIDKFLFNVCRNKRSGPPEFHEETQWSSTGGTYHYVEKFGELIMGEINSQILFHRPINMEMKFRTENSRKQGGDTFKKLEEEVNPQNVSYNFLNEVLNVFSEFSAKPGYRDLLYFNLIDLPMKFEKEVENLSLRYKIDSDSMNNIDLKLTFRIVDKQGQADWDYVQIPSLTNDWQVFQFSLLKGGARAKSAPLKCSSVSKVNEIKLMLSPGSINKNQTLNLSIDNLEFKE